MPREFQRCERVSSLVQRELAAILQTEFKDPRLGFVTVNAVEVSRDLSVAKVYISVLDSDEKAESSLDLLKRSSAVLRRDLAKRVRMRTVPELRFVYDTSVERGVRLSSLITKLSSSGSGHEE